MPESEPTQKRLSRMEKDLSDLTSMTRSLLNFHGEDFRKEMLEKMRKDDVLRAVYLLVDGELGQTEIGAKIGGAAQRTVDRKFTDLEGWGLIQYVTRPAKGGTVWARSPTARALRLERDLK